MNKCKQCGKETKNPKFCSRSCSIKVANKTCPKRKKTIYREKNCLNCDKKLNQYQTKYCSHECQHKNKNYEYTKRWLDNKETGYKSLGCSLSSRVRSWVFENQGTQCSECGWDEKHPDDGKTLTHIDHIDGDAKNCRPENLRVLCPNCHSKTSTFGARNTGRGSRRKKVYKQ